MAYNAGEFESALSQIQAAGRIGKSTDEVARRFLAEEWTAEVLVALDRMGEALQLSNELLQAAERGHQAWEIRTIESFQARVSLMVGRLADTSAILEDRFSVEGTVSMGLQDAAALVAFGRAALHAGNERDTRRATQIASSLLTYEVPGVRRRALWLLALAAMTSGDASAAHAHLCGMGEDGRLSLPLIRVRAY